jgi:hypothetical protein
MPVALQSRQAPGISNSAGETAYAQTVLPTARSADVAAKVTGWNEYVILHWQNARTESLGSGADEQSRAVSSAGAPVAKLPTPSEQISATIEDLIASLVRFPETDAKHKKHLEYLTRVSTSECAVITPTTAVLAARAWRDIWTASRGQMSIPAACTGPDGEMFYSWDRGRHHLELEIIPGQPAEFFYRDRETEQFWGDDYTIGDPLPARVVEKLTLFY